MAPRRPPVQLAAWRARPFAGRHGFDSLGCGSAQAVGRKPMIRAAAHVHSDWSYDGSWTLAALADEFGSRGYDAVLMTEHDRGFDQDRWAAYRKACAEASRGALLVPGIEYSDPENLAHVAVWGDIPFLGEGRATAELRRGVASKGGAAMFAHPERRQAGRRLDDQSQHPSRGHRGFEPQVRRLGAGTDGKSPLRPTVWDDPVFGLDFHTRRQLFPLGMVIDAEKPGTVRIVVDAMLARRSRPIAFGVRGRWLTSWGPGLAVALICRASPGHGCAQPCGAGASLARRSQARDGPRRSIAATDAPSRAALAPVSRGGARLGDGPRRSIAATDAPSRAALAPVSRGGARLGDGRPGSSDAPGYPSGPCMWSFSTLQLPPRETGQQLIRDTSCGRCLGRDWFPWGWDPARRRQRRRHGRESRSRIAEPLRPSSLSRVAARASRCPGLHPTLVVRPRKRVSGSGLVAVTVGCRRGPHTCPGMWNCHRQGVVDAPLPKLVDPHQSADERQSGRRRAPRGLGARPRTGGSSPGWSRHCASPLPLLRASRRGASPFSRTPTFCRWRAARSPCAPGCQPPAWRSGGSGTASTAFCMSGRSRSSVTWTVGWLAPTVYIGVLYCLVLIQGP